MLTNLRTKLGALGFLACFLFMSAGVQAADLFSFDDATDAVTWDVSDPKAIVMSALTAGLKIAGLLLGIVVGVRFLIRMFKTN